MNLLGNLWERIKAAIEGEAHEIDQVLTDLEKKLLPGFSALLKQIETTIGEQGLTILEQGLSDIATVIESGGNVGEAISVLVPKVLGQAQEDLKQDEMNAAHGVIALILANVTKPAASE